MKRASRAIARHAPLAAALALAFAAFLPALSNGFVNWDDNANIVDNWNYRGLGAAQLRWMFTTLHMGHYQPLAWLSLGADFTLWGMNPLGYHLTSVLFHLANAALFYFVALRLLSAATQPNTPPLATSEQRTEVSDSDAASEAADAPLDMRLRVAAAFAASLFAVHPLRVESVAWVTERRDVVSGFFFLASVLAYLRATQDAGPRTVPRWRALSIACFALALAGKATTVVLPALLLLLDVFPLRRRDRGATAARLVIEKAPYLVLAAAAIALGLRAQHTAVAFPSMESFDIGERIATAIYGIAFYARKTLVPLGLTPAHVLHGDLEFGAPRVFASFFVAAAITAFCVAARARRPALLAAWLAYIVTIAPTLGFVQKFSYAAADRYSYLSCLGFAILGGGAWLAASRRRGNDEQIAVRRSDSRGAIANTAALVAVATLALLTARQCGVWRDSESLWRHALGVDARNPIALDNLGHDLIRQGRLDEARTAFEGAIAERPGFSDALAGLGQIALIEARPAEARTILESALASWPRNPVALTNLGVAHLQLGDGSAAIESFRAAARAEPRFYDAWHNLGATLLAAGDSLGALDAFQRAAQIRPREAAPR
ncbi:MAG: tetratricopeptide repeat protein [bacterium]